MSAFYKLSPPASPVKSSKPLLLKYYFSTRNVTNQWYHNTTLLHQLCLRSLSLHGLVFSSLGNLRGWGCHVDKYDEWDWRRSWKNAATATPRSEWILHYFSLAPHSPPRWSPGLWKFADFMNSTECWVLMFSPHHPIRLLLLFLLLSVILLVVTSGERDLARDTDGDGLRWTENISR